MREFLLDTVGLVGYLEDALPRAADRVTREAEAGRSLLLLPQVALAEFAYICLRGRLKGLSALDVTKAIRQILASSAIRVTGMPESAWEIFATVPVPELHDRMIASEALARGTPLITNDRSLRAVANLHIVW